MSMLARKRQTQREREFEFTTRDFEAVRDMLYTHAGISLGEGKADLVYGRLARRLRALRIGSFSEYLSYVGSDPGRGELVKFVNALTTNLTAFFREPHHFAYLRDVASAEIIERHRHDRRVRLWSAGCSTGEESYSIAMTLKETPLARAPWDTRLLATDLDSDVVEAARAGTYASQRVAGLDGAQARKWFLPGTAANQVQMSSELQALITFKQLNLMDEWPMRGPFDLIFCRNVVIYFDKPTQRRLFQRFADMLVPGGYLFLGHSETMHNLSDRFELVGKTVYRKVS